MSNLGYDDLRHLPIKECGKCHKTKRILVFAQVNLCEDCLGKAQQIIRKWANADEIQKEKSV